MSQLLFNAFSDNEFPLLFQLYGLGINHIQEPIQRLEGVPFCQWIQCIKGSGRVYLNQQEFILNPGQGMFIYPNEPNCYHSYANSENWVVNFICFKSHVINELFKNTSFKVSGVFTLSEPDVITQKIESMYYQEPLAPLLSSTLYSIAIYDLVFHLFLYARTEQGTSLSTQNYKIAPAIVYIENNYNKAIYLDELSVLCHISQEYLCELFKKTTGMRVFEFIQRTRIKHSKAFLIGMSDVSIDKIGSLCGFNSLSYFIKIFKRFENMSPGEFRKQNGVSGEIRF